MQVKAAATPYRRSAGTARTHGLQTDKISCEMGIPLVRREAESAAAEMRYFWRLGMSRQVATQSLHGDSYAQTVSGLRRHIVVLSLVRQAIRIPMSITCVWKNSLPCQLNCVALGPSIPGLHPVYPSRAIEPCSSRQSVQVVRAGDGARIRRRSSKWERG
jgi:hypothetical protein